MFCETEHLIMAMMASKKHVGSLKNVLGSELRRLYKVTFQAYIWLILQHFKLKLSVKMNFLGG